MVKSKAKAFSYSANDVWAVACKAQRLNKEYINLYLKALKRKLTVRSFIAS